MRALPIFTLFWCAACGSRPPVALRADAPLPPLPPAALDVGWEDPAPEERVEPPFAEAPTPSPLLAETWQEDLGDDINDGALGGQVVSVERGGHRDPARLRPPADLAGAPAPATRVWGARLVPEVILDGVWTRQLAVRHTQGPDRDTQQRTRTTAWLAMVRLRWRGRRRGAVRKRRGVVPAAAGRLLAVAITTAGLCSAARAQPLSPLPPSETEARADELRARLASEPALARVQQAALRFLGLEGTGVSVGRVRASAWLPHAVQVDVGWTRAGGQRDDDTYTRTGPGDGTWDSLQWRALDRVDATTRQDIGVRLQWDLQALVWNDDELSVLAHQRRMDEARQRVLQLVAQTYHQRRRAMATLWLHWDAAPEVRLSHELDVEALTASLDAMTGGWFSTALAPASAPVSPASP